MEIVVYLLKVNIAIVLFFAMYYIVFKRDTFFSLKRFILLSAVIFSLFYPLWDFYSLLSAKVILVQTNDAYAISLSSINVSPDAQEQAFSISRILPAALLVVYLSGVIFCFLQIVIQSFSIYQVVRKSQKIEIFGQKVRVSKEAQTPFSFFGTIIMNEKDYSQSEFTEIMLHELTINSQTAVAFY